MPIRTHTLTLARAEMISPHVRHLAFTSKDNAFLNFKPGQFITIHFPVDDKMLRRSYSIATIPGESELIEIAAGFVEDGPGTKLLFDLQPGDEINAAGAFGRLILRDESPKRYIFAATSTGVTPFRSMLPDLAKRLNEQDLEVILLFGVQYRADLIYGEEFLDFAQKHPNFHFQAHYSRETAENLQAHERIGYVQTAFNDLKPQADSDIVYLCGNPSMIDEAFADLTARGFDVKNVRREKYISN